MLVKLRDITLHCLLGFAVISGPVFPYNASLSFWCLLYHTKTAGRTMNPEETPGMSVHVDSEKKAVRIYT